MSDKCLRGHIRTMSNTAVRKNGKIECKLCRSVRDRKRRATQAQARAMESQ